MPKYLVLWEVDMSKVPVDIKERAAAWSVMLDMVKQEIAEGRTTDWGSFVGEMKGYSVGEGTEVEFMLDLQRFIPWLNFKVHQIASVDQVGETIKAMSE